MRHLVLLGSFAFAASPVAPGHPDQWIAVSGFAAAALLIVAGALSLKRFLNQPSRDLRWLANAAIWCVGLHLSLVVFARFTEGVNATSTVAPNIVLGMLAFLSLIALSFGKLPAKRRSQLADGALLLAALHIIASNDPNSASYGVVVTLLLICALRSWHSFRATTTTAASEISKKAVHP